MTTKDNSTHVALMDEYGNAYPLFQHSTDNASLTINNVTDRVELPGNGVVYLFTANKDCWLTFGDNTVTAAVNSGRFFLAGTEPVRPPVGATHVSGVTDDGTTGKLGITSMVGE